MITMEWYSDPFAHRLDMDKMDIEGINKIIVSGVEKDISNLNDRRLGVLNYASEYSGVAKLLHGIIQMEKGVRPG